MRRARERMEAGLPPEMPPPPPQPIQQRSPPRAYNDPRAAPSPPQQAKVRGPMPAALSAARDEQTIGVAISRPTRVPQWPLGGPALSSQDQQFNNQGYQPPAGRGKAPQRPPRPRNVPSMLDASKLQEHTPSFQYQAQNAGERIPAGEDLLSPDMRSPMTGNSRQSSTYSSVGSIPDFPVPVAVPVSVPVTATGPATRRSINLGPPPTSRRGASSYYSHNSYVSPIPEESPRAQQSHGSYASSAAIPVVWGSEDSPGYDYYDGDDSPRDFDVIEEGRESRESNDDGEERGLVRSASIGRRGKPSMVTTKSSEKTDQISNHPNKLAKMGVFGVDEMRAAGAATGAPISRPGPQALQGQRDTVWPIMGDVGSPLASGTGLIDPSTSSSETVPTIARAVTANEPIPAPNNSNSDVNRILAAHDTASHLRQDPPELERSFSRLSAIRRPPRLDINAVRDAEARGSLTSLPDLIRRATRLAAMMDKGKRPGSRLDDLNMFASDSDLSRDKEMSGEFVSIDHPSLQYFNTAAGEDEKRQSGLSNMLAAFPPPGLATPTRGKSPRPLSTWPTPYDGNETASATDASSPNDGKKQRRRCCGLPVPTFLIVLFILLLIIAAAVVVPLELLVFNKPTTKTPVSAQESLLAQCQAKTTCANGGTNIVISATISDACACICANGFTGSDCTIVGTLGCTTTNIMGNSSSTSGSTLSNVTLGQAIPRLVSQAQSNFSIPLVGETILARFNTGGLSCDAENALVTFDGLNSRIGNAGTEVSSAADSSITQAAVRRRSVKRDEKRAAIEMARAEIEQQGQGTITASLTVIISTGDPKLVGTSTSFVTSTSSSSSSPTQLVTAAPTTSKTKTSSAASATTTSGTSFVVTEVVLDFARVAVLYVLQQQKLDNAVTAQSALQKFFSLSTTSRTQSAAQSLSLGNGNTIDLLRGTVNVGNGSVGAGNGLKKRHWNGELKRWVLMGVIDLKATVMHGGGD